MKLIAVLALALVAAPASASRSDVHQTEGGSIRLVSSGLADAEGHLRGVLEIALRPGWKTYWRDPGASGVPPRIDVGGINVDAAEIGFPRPEWHEDDYGAWAGYEGSVSLPVTFHIPRPDRYALIEADIFLGVCQTICIPVQARLTLEPGADPDDPEDRAIVETAFDALPRPAGPEFGVAAVHVDGNRLKVEVELPENAAVAELFLAGRAGYAFGVPRRVAAETAAFEVTLVARPTGPAGPTRIDYTLGVGPDAVSGWFELP